EVTAAPSSTSVSSMPSQGAATSTTILSVSSSATGSSRVTALPASFSQPWKMTLSPLFCSGARISVDSCCMSKLQQVVNPCADIIHGRYRGIQQFGMMRARDVGHGEPGHRRIQIEEGLVGDGSGDFRAETGRAQILMDDQAAV